MAKLKLVSGSLRMRLLPAMVLLVMLPMSIITHPLQARNTKSPGLNETKPHPSRIISLPHLSSPRQVLEKMTSGLMRTVRRTAEFSKQMFGDKMTSMARTGRQINRGIITTGRSFKNLFRDMFH